MPKERYVSVWSLTKGFAFAVALSLLLYFAIRAIGLDRIREQVVAAGALGPVVFVLLKASTNVFAPLSGAPYYLLAEPLFGFWKGTTYIFLGDVIGYFIGFSIARYWGKAVVSRIAGQGVIRKTEEYYTRLGGWQGLLYARIFLPGAQDVISYAAGLTSMSFGEYSMVTALGSIPPSIILVVTGGAIVENAPVTALVYGALAVAVLVMLWLYRRRSKRNRPKDI